MLPVVLVVLLCLCERVSAQTLVSRYESTHAITPITQAGGFTLVYDASNNGNYAYIDNINRVHVTTLDKQCFGFNTELINASPAYWTNQQAMGALGAGYSPLVSNFPTTKFSIAAWIKPNSYMSQSPLQSYGSFFNLMRVGLNSSGVPMSMADNVFGIKLASSTITITLNGADSQQLVSANTITADVWNHIAATFSNGTIFVYVNGVQKLSYQTITTSFPIGNYSFLFGAVHLGAPFKIANSGPQLFVGGMDSMMLFNDVLASAAITNLYNKVPICAGIMYVSFKTNLTV
jgi:hypothetical protein